MKNIITKLFVGVFCASSLFTTTSCIDETYPTQTATEEQLASSSKATEALLWAIPAYVNKLESYSTNHYDWGYGSIMHVRDVMTGDLAVQESDYDVWYDGWHTNQSLGENYAYTQFLWNYYWPFVQTQNNLIAVIDTATAKDAQLGMLAAAKAYRALAYLDMARMYEFLPNDKTDTINAKGNNVKNLTVPIVRETTTVEEARNNPRVHRDEMAAFILEDLEYAEKNIAKFTLKDKVFPHIDAVYGLKARLYMWLEDYENAKKYARLAIDNSSVAPMDSASCINPVTGFNQLSKWMWGSQMVKEDDVVQSGILNWTAWMSPEATYGYACAGPMSKIDVTMYNRISNNDFRKLWFKAPAGHPLSGSETYTEPANSIYIAEYAAIKFRPNAGEVEDYEVASASAFPIMRVEEMYFIEAEAAEHLAAGEGVALLENFMTTYRDKTYQFPAIYDAIDEIVFQKRVELWGEGQAFYDIKRLDMSVTRGYTGTNFKEAARLNTNGRPAWMNLCIVVNEGRNNKAVLDWGNPNPSGLYTPWTE